MAPPLLTLRDIRITFGSTPLLMGAELTVAPGDRLCLVGRNGSGKSTLLKIAAGLIEADAGERFIHPNASIRYLPQEADFSDFGTVAAYVEAGLGPTDDPYRAHQLLEDCGLTGDRDPVTLSGGEARRAALVRVLAARPDILLLDEPTNHLDLPAIAWLEEKLEETRSAIILISHDRRLLESIGRSTVWIDRGQARRLDQNFSKFEVWRDRQIEQEELELHKLERKIEREERWMYGGGVTARRKRNMRRVGELQQMRKARSEFVRPQGEINVAPVDATLSGKLVIEAEHLSKSYAGTAIVRDFSTRILRGDRIGIIGPNGAGKTTLLRMLTGELEPDAGSLRLGSNLEIVSLDQKREDLKADWTVADALTGGRGDQVLINGKPRHVTGYLRDFLFQPEQARSPISALSGGERGRLMLARALAKSSNLLVLDEPTNDLDLETLDLLQELLSDYAGTVLLVSHDRDFLDRVVTSTIAADVDGRWLEYAGGYSDMLAQRGGRDIGEKPTPSRPKQTSSKPDTKPPEKSQAAPSPKRKLSFKDKHALETLPAQMENLTNEIERLHTEISDEGLFARDAQAFEAATVRLAEAQDELERAEEKWLELEMLREELES